MRFSLPFLLLLLPCCLFGQGTPPMDPSQAQPRQSEARGTAPISEPGTAAEVKKLVKREINQAIMGKHYPELDQWQPLTPKEKFHIFLVHTYSPRTFAGAGIDAVKYKIKTDHREYERGA